MSKDEQSDVEEILRQNWSDGADEAQEEPVDSQKELTRQQEATKNREEDTGRIDTKRKAPQKKSTAKTVLGILGALVVAAGFIGGGVLLGTKLSSKSDDDGSVAAGLPEASGAGVLATSATANEDDKLALAFLKMHNQRENANYSPLSIRYALEMLREGAGGETRAQLDELLGSQEPTRYDNVAEHLALANSLWIKEGLQGQVKQSYKDVLQEKFNAEVKVDDFTSAAKINKWISDSTLGLLENIMQDEDVHGLTAALVNALAVDMEWKTQFDTLDTYGAPFNDENWSKEQYDDENNYTTVMNGIVVQNSNWYYSLAADATLFASDLKEYMGTKLQFVAMMPENLPEFIENLDMKKYNELIGSLRMAKSQNDTYTLSLNVNIPKFKIDGGVEDLDQDLRKMGVTDIFDAEKANFTSMTDANGFFIDKITHKTQFEFMEEGIRAAAVTVAGGKGSTGGPHIPDNAVSVVLGFDKPFMYVLRDVRTGEIWFVGTVYEPNKWAEDKADYVR